MVWKEIRKYLIVEISILLIVAIYALFPQSIDLKVFLYSLFSFGRMLAAYVISLIFSIFYGLYAAINKKAEKILIPTLDILQSVPILGFFPVVLFLFIYYFPAGIGVELASIILIFTSQAWNMAFGVYESIITIPKELREVTNAFSLTGLSRFRILYFPAMIPRLVYNSMMSWAGGWYFLFAAEIISVGNVNYTLPGLGSFLWTEVEDGHIFNGLLALFTLILIIIAMDILIWRPLAKVSEKYKYESVAETAPERRLYLLNILKFLPLFKKPLNIFRKIIERITTVAKFPLFSKIWKNVKYVGYAFLIFIFSLIVYAIILAFQHGISVEISPSYLSPVPLAIVLSILRLSIAYFLSLLWIIPVAIYLKSKKEKSKYLVPVFEILASIPATALFPFFVLLLINLPFGVDLASIFLIMTGMQWYILFNVLSGINTFPSDFDDVSRVFRLTRWQYIRKVLLPGIYPSIITGSITGWGGGWNALIVSEYIVVNGVVYSVLGLGYLIDYATYDLGNVALNILYVMVMVLVVFTLNKLLWRRLYERAKLHSYEV